MAYEILSESYGRRLPKIAAEADSADDLATLGTNWAEGSTCVIGDTTYKLDKVQGWVEPGSGGGGGGLLVHVAHEEGAAIHTCDKTWKEIKDAVEAGGAVYFDIENYNSYYTSYTEPLSSLYTASDLYSANTTSLSFVTDSEDGYPVAETE